MSIFTPNLYLHRITDLTPELLAHYGIKGIVLDVDNTLTHHGSQEVSQPVLDWLAQMRNAGMKLTIASNNYEKRINPFAAKLKLDYISMSCKPMTFAFTKACKKFGLSKKEVALVGDQVYTDILGGNIKGMFTVLVQPFELEHGMLFRIKRRLEKFHLRKCKLQEGGKE
ncbi:YqeG family HAD IIIA-type phosphatase [Massiliimalia massiliensis]|uniref:YqeG family HAD IIIA-type phosphatase n=1 Tax=Massiliimalia massiliensis TaxID=1852384 RepID=UPI001356292F|nr:YqeG family HAD IIIA-type phosphatase [Massiliimalia massiliensis]